MDREELRPNPFHSDPRFRVIAVAGGALIGASKSSPAEPGRLLGYSLFGALAAACGLWLLARPTRFRRWPLAFGASGLVLGLTEGAVQGGAEGAMIGAWVGAVVSGVVGLIWGAIVCVAAKVLR